jgi:hypothetical protein
MHARLLTPLAALGLAALCGCAATDTHRAPLGHLTIHLTDAPGDFEQVNLVVTRVSVHRSDQAWETLKDETVTYDLMELRNGVFAVLAAGDVPAGHYTQVRLHIGEGTNVVVDGVAHPLFVPSGMQTGYKLVGEFDVPAGGDVEITLDFDAARSIVLTGEGDYILKPTARVIVGDQAGRIVGRLLPEGAEAEVLAMQGTEILQSTEAGPDGRFVLAALPAGDYSVAIHPSEGYRDTTLTEVAVTSGATTDLGDVELTPE